MLSNINFILWMIWSHWQGLSGGWGSNASFSLFSSVSCLQLPQNAAAWVSFGHRVWHLTKAFYSDSRSIQRNFLLRWNQKRPFKWANHAPALISIQQRQKRLCAGMSQRSTWPHQVLASWIVTHKPCSTLRTDRSSNGILNFIYVCVCMHVCVCIVCVCVLSPRYYLGLWDLMCCFTAWQL